MFNDEIEIGSSRMPASSGMEITSSWEDMDRLKKEMDQWREEMAVEPWPIGGFGG